MIRVRHFEHVPIYRFYMTSVAAGGRGIETIEVPVYNAIAELPGAIDALVVAGDLQGVISADVPPENRVLAGVGIAEQWGTLASCGLVPALERTGLLLTGDLYTVPGLDKRGGTGDVDLVWAAFAERFRWVVGVAGNHDTFHGRWGYSHLGESTGGELLDGMCTERDGIQIGGVSGIIGDGDKPWRRHQTQFLDAVSSVLAVRPDILVLHEAPSAPDQSERGHRELLRQLEAHSPPTLVAFGHVHWRQPFLRSGGLQLLNTEARMVLVTREKIAPL